MTTKVHVLEAPMILTSDVPSKTMSLLPAGTTLYYDKSYPEGFTRYKVYINIDRHPLALSNLSDPTEIVPIDARVPDKEDLERLLREYPISKAELAAILKSSRISKEEIREVLHEYSK